MRLRNQPDTSVFPGRAAFLSPWCWRCACDKAACSVHLRRGFGRHVPWSVRHSRSLDIKVLIKSRKKQGFGTYCPKQLKAFKCITISRATRIGPWSPQPINISYYKSVSSSTNRKYYSYQTLLPLTFNLLLSDIWLAVKQFTEFLNVIKF